jgi:isochorismate synthase
MIGADGMLEDLGLLLEQPVGPRRLVSVTERVDLADPSAAVFASRLATDRWFCWEQPDRDGFALAGLGSAHEVVSRGPGRFADVALEIAEIGRGARSAGLEEAPAGAGPVWTGGFAFDPGGGASPPWSSFPPALFMLPELSILRIAGEAYLTLTAFSGGPDGSGEAVERLRRRLASLLEQSLPMLDPSPTVATTIVSASPPGRYEESVAAGVERIRAGELEKVVLAREVAVEAGAAHDPAAVYGALRELFPSCFSFCAGSPEAAFLGASPELLVRRRGAGVATVALAGSTRRSADPSIDDHLGEQLMQSEKNRIEHRITARRIERKLAPRSVWVEASEEPVLIKVANIQHLATPVHAQLAEPLSAIELAGLLHPTPAVGGEPDRESQAAIAELEDMDRGWYAGPVGWMDAAEDGEFCVALRSALLRDRTAHLFAGAGIVADSDPASELAETELKLGALLPLLAG